ncbi:hypothetical protein B0F90DRAFT_685226 [Multifurca ochricompacta]|uniref:Uncharacterized protein n=1 Tax=Multifurca ochricompacta TaxID=376703 RepID=A0AAD4QMJ8_9AGAM|nr:hypothetical protein B0F90DRAFT_685226 [Multifurca ochricompacta]
MLKRVRCRANPSIDPIPIPFNWQLGYQVEVRGGYEVEWVSFGFGVSNLARLNLGGTRDANVFHFHLTSAELSSLLLFSIRDAQIARGRHCYHICDKWPKKREGRKVNCRHGFGIIHTPHEYIIIVLAGQRKKELTKEKLPQSKVKFESGIYIL